jgi:uncharacterized phage protein gp47/JayE
MPYARPTLTALRNQAIQDITTSGVPGLDGLLRNAVLRVLAWVMSGLAYSVYGYVDWTSLMGVPFTARDEYLEAWAALVGIFRKDATAASGTAQFTGQTGTPLPAGAPLTRQDGTPYVSTEDATVDATGNILVPFIATVTGSITDCDDGTPISLGAPPSGINSGGVTVGPTTGGADQEQDDELRTRMLERYRAPPQGGSVADYQQWALEVPGCTRAWVQYGGYGPGSVVVRPMFDDVQAAHGGFPQGTDGCATNEPRGPTATGDQLAVADHIRLTQPVTALIYVAAPVALPVNVTLIDLSPNTAELQTDIIAALNDMFLMTAEAGGTIYPSDLYEAILATPNIEHFVMTLPAGPVQATVSQLPVMGILTAPTPP